VRAERDGDGERDRRGDRDGGLLGDHVDHGRDREATELERGEHALGARSSAECAATAHVTAVAPYVVEEVPRAPSLSPSSRHAARSTQSACAA
jgi:hypothetical protein